VIIALLLVKETSIDPVERKVWCKDI